MRLKGFQMRNVKNTLLNKILKCIFKKFLLSMSSIEQKGDVPIEITHQEWGVESAEYRQAQELETSREIILPPDATFFDLLGAIGPEQFMSMWKYANGYAPPDALELIEQLLQNDPDKLYSMGLVDFFNSYDYVLEDMREYLGIVFEA